MEKNNCGSVENEKCLLCGEEKFPIDEFGTKDCNCRSLEKALSNAFKEN